jgi:hypothetical protein
VFRGQGRFYEGLDKVRGEEMAFEKGREGPL